MSEFDNCLNTGSVGLETFGVMHSLKQLYRVMTTALGLRRNCSDSRFMHIIGGSPNAAVDSAKSCSV